MVGGSEVAFPTQFRFCPRASKRAYTLQKTFGTPSDPAAIIRLAKRNGIILGWQQPLSYHNNAVAEITTINLQQ